jgi:hypothetical protein
VGDALKEIGKELDLRYEISRAILHHMENALFLYSDILYKNVNLPRCSREHLTYIVKELKDYVEETHKIRCELPRLLENGSGFDD